MSFYVTPLIHQLVISNIASTITSYLASAIRNIFSSNERPDNREKELDRLQMNRLMKWMDMFFQEETTDIPIKNAYRQELYNIYKTIASDYKQYENWKRYNQSLWLIRTYRQKNTNWLAQKILDDLVLFHEGVNLFSKC